MGDLTNKVVTSTLDIVDMQEKIKDAEFIIKRYILNLLIWHKTM